MYLFIGAVAVLSLTVSCNGKYRKIAWLSFFLFSAIYVSLRNIGTDWLEYAIYYDQHNILEFFDGYFEIGFSLILSFFKLCGLSYAAAAGAISLVCCFIFFKATNHYTNSFGFVALLASFYIFYPGLETIRQLVTIVLFYYSLIYIDFDWKKYFGINFLGILFHRTGIVTFFFYFFRKHKLVKIAYFIALAMYVLVEPYLFKLLMHFPSVYQKYYWYRVVKHNSVDSLLSLKLMEYLMLIIAVLLLKMQKANFSIKISSGSRKNSHHIGTNQSEGLREVLETGENKFFDLMIMGMGIQLFVKSILASSYRLLYYSDIGVLMTFCFLHDRTSKRNRFLLEVTAVIYIAIRFYRLFSVNTQLFY